jgi:hypothetical protein
MKNPPTNPTADSRLLAAPTVTKLHGAKLAVRELHAEFPALVVVAMAFIQLLNMSGGKPTNFTTLDAFDI